MNYGFYQILYMFSYVSYTVRIKIRFKIFDLGLGPVDLGGFRWL